jgi:thioredoxin reductase
MPVDMHLKSDGFASNLYDPDKAFTLKHYCAEQNIPYTDYGSPVALDTFVSYALEFQKRLVPTLEPKSVVDVRSEGLGFRLRLEDGETLTSKTVVIASGISYFGYVPAALSSLPNELCTHSSAHGDLSHFRGKRVVVIGAGASATDLAALLNKAGSTVRLVCRKPPAFHLPPNNAQLPLWKRIRQVNLGLGPGIKSAVYTAFPGLFHFLPLQFRQQIVRTHLGPAGGWFVRDDVIGKVHLDVGYTVESAQAANGSVLLRLVDGNRKSLEVEADHVIAATGYRASVDRLDLIDSTLRSQIRREDESPILSPTFESSVPGLYFVGLASAIRFGPVMRFARGAEYAADRLSKHLAGAYAAPKTSNAGRAATA